MGGGGGGGGRAVSENMFLTHFVLIIMKLFWGALKTILTCLKSYCPLWVELQGTKISN